MKRMEKPIKIVLLRHRRLTFLTLGSEGLIDAVSLCLAVGAHAGWDRCRCSATLAAEAGAPSPRAAVTPLCSVRAGSWAFVFLGAVALASCLP